MHTLGNDRWSSGGSKTAPVKNMGNKHFDQPQTAVVGSWCSQFNQLANKTLYPLNHKHFVRKGLV